MSKRPHYRVYRLEYCKPHPSLPIQAESDEHDSAGPTPSPLVLSSPRGGLQQWGLATV
jgi:hypothetical protein